MTYTDGYCCGTFVDLQVFRSICTTLTDPTADVRQSWQSNSGQIPMMKLYRLRITNTWMEARRLELTTAYSRRRCGNTKAAGIGWKLDMWLKAARCDVKPWALLSIRRCQPLSLDNAFPDDLCLAFLSFQREARQVIWLWDTHFILSLLFGTRPGKQLSLSNSLGDQQN